MSVSMSASPCINIDLDDLLKLIEELLAHLKKMEKHAGEHAVGGSDAFNGSIHQISMMVEKVDSLPPPNPGRIVYLTSDNHIYLTVP